MKSENTTAITAPAPVAPVAPVVVAPVTHSIDYAGLHSLCVACDTARASVESITAKEYLDAMQTLSDALSTYNRETMEAAFSECDSLASLFTRGHFSAFYARYNQKAGETSLVSRETRFSVSSFLAYCKEQGKAIPGASLFSVAVDSLVSSLQAFITSELTYSPESKTGKSVKIDSVVACLLSVVEVVNIPGIFARPKDIRFLAYAVTGGAGSIGALREFGRADVEKFLVDVFHVQLAKKAYSFEQKKAGK